MKLKVLTLALLAISATAMAQTPGGGGGVGGGGDHGGGDHAGGMSPEEAQRMMAERQQPKPPKPIRKEAYDATVREEFAACDLNKDGFVSLDELHQILDARRAQIIDARFTTVDTNHDGTINRDEFNAWQRRQGDAEISQFSGAHGKALPPGDEMDVDLASGRPRRGKGETKESLMISLIITPINTKTLIEADTNHDGRLSLAEDLAFQDAVFDKADTNHDAFLDIQEIMIAREARQSARP